MERKVFLGQNLIWVMVLLGQMHGYRSCTQKERKALLELKQYIISITKEEESDSVFTTWTNDTTNDCCHWDEIKCNQTSGRVIELSFGSLDVKESSLLNLSLLHPFEEVQNLDLYGCQWSGLFDNVNGYKSLRRLRNLEIMDLSFNEFNNSIFPFLNAATSLKTLFLGGNNMDGPVPAKELKNLSNLELLDLSWNRFNNSIPESSGLRNLRAMRLTGNKFPDSMELQGICKLKNVQELDLSQTNLAGQFPLCLTSLTRLKVLDLSSNQLSGKVPSALGNLESLEYLSLLDNNFQGFFALGSLANLSELKVLKLSSQSNSLQVESESSWKPKFQLSVIVLRSCNLEKVPHFLLHQKNLRHLDLSNNSIPENFPSWLLANNPKLEYMNLAKNNFQGNLPSSLGNMKKLKLLDISHNNFRGELPRSMVKGCYSLLILKLSYNKLSGDLFPESANFTDINELSMDNNMFTGRIGQGLRSLRSLAMLDISNNNLSGVIPSSIGEFRDLISLLLSNNSLEGEIPISLFNLSDLHLLDLSGNKLSGDIPPHVNSRRPIVLLLQDNNFSRVIPNTLLMNVMVLDLRNNKLSGNIPEFINTQSISILLFRGNNFTGPIPRQLCGLRNIKLLDLANNRLKGSIPSCLSNTSLGLGKDERSYGYDTSFVYATVDERSSNLVHAEDTGIYFVSLLVLDQFGMDYLAEVKTEIEFATKHRYDSYTGGNLFDFSGLDLSQNELSGEIPIELGSLLELHALNLSHNNLSGRIPESFSGLKNVESLDLSFNRLQGRIPPQLTDMTNLAVFNVSYNNLSGVIPQGRQFNTFDARSYFGNPLLCGEPTNISCNGNNFQEPENEVETDESTIDMESFYWSFAAAYVTILAGILASLFFNSPWSRAWFNIVDAFIKKVRNL